MKEMIQHCTLCPRQCGADRTAGVGYCGAPGEVRIARAALHRWEEPCISGQRGSGTVLFVGCPLHCVFCQNQAISGGGGGRALTTDELAQTFLDLQLQGAHNINLVSPTQYIPAIAEALRAVRGQLHIPVVYNTGGYERVESLRELAGLVDVYLPDVKYFDPALSKAYAAAPDYFARAMEALREMLTQVGRPVIREGMLTRGVLVRHLVLPGCRRDSLAILRALTERFSPEDFLFSLMRQYTPMPGVPRELARTLTTFEYESVADEVRRAGFDGFFQGKEAASKDYIPPFE